MPNLPERKAGIISCSGEELAEGTVARLAALKVLHELRPGETVTICLPLFLAGGEGDRAFTRFHPTITVDGCELRCAARGTEMYSGKPAASIVVNDLVAEQGIGKPEGRRQLNEAGKQAVDITAERLAALVDHLLGKQDRSGRGEEEPTPSAARQQGGTVGCSCGSGIPLQKVTIDGHTVELMALPLIFRHLRETGRNPGEAGDELLALAKIYNEVPPQEEKSYREAMLREYEVFCQKEATQ
jgi:uncharacterized metal-binding protein